MAALLPPLRPQAAPLVVWTASYLCENEWKLTVILLSQLDLIVVCRIFFRWWCNSVPYCGESSANVFVIREIRISSLFVFFWVIPLRLVYICRRFGTDRVFRNVGIYKSDAGKSPKRKQTTFWTRRKLEIKKQNIPALFNDFFFTVHPTTIPSFQLATSLVSLQNLLKRRSRSASCASNPPKCCFLEATARTAYVPWTTLWSPQLQSHSPNGLLRQRSW